MFDEGFVGLGRETLRLTTRVSRLVEGPDAGLPCCQVSMEPALATRPLSVSLHRRLLQLRSRPTQRQEISQMLKGVVGEWADIDR